MVAMWLGRLTKVMHASAALDGAERHAAELHRLLSKADMIITITDAD